MILIPSSLIFTLFDVQRQSGPLKFVLSLYFRSCATLIISFPVIFFFYLVLRGGQATCWSLIGFTLVGFFVLYFIASGDVWQAGRFS